MKTRYLVRLESNITALYNTIPTNEHPTPNINDILETSFYETITNKASKIPKMKKNNTGRGEKCY